VSTLIQPLLSSPYKWKKNKGLNLVKTTQGRGRIEASASEWQICALNGKEDGLSGRMKKGAKVGSSRREGLHDTVSGDSNVVQDLLDEDDADVNVLRDVGEELIDQVIDRVKR
jgi:hypothetical protein